MIVTKVQKISTFLFLALGLLCLLLPKQTATVTVIIMLAVFFLSALKFLIDGIRMHRGVDLIAAIVLVILGGFGIYAFGNGYHFVIDAFGIYMLACGIILIIQMILDLQDHSDDWKAELIMGILYSLCGLLALFFSKDDIVLVQSLLGGYLILQALQNVLEMFFFTRKYNARYYAFRNWMALPAFVVGMLPAVVYDFMLRKKMKDPNMRLTSRKSDEVPDLSVFIHTGTYASRLYGHMTFSRSDTAYSYGDYDRAAERLMHSIGPGTFFTVGSDIYSNNCSIVEHSPQFEFGIRLSEQQKERFDEMIQNVLDSTTPWKCPLEELPMDEVDEKFPEYEKNYASRLWYRTGAQFRQYHSGTWAWYALLGNNCSNFAAAKLNEIGLHIPVAKGVVSPGEFFEYYEEAYEDPDSNVICRSFHSAEFPDSLFKTID